MTNEQLTAYLQDDSYLYAVSYEELKTLVMQYPYATNLRILLLKKSFLEQNKDYDRNLQMAATFATNRKYLYRVVQKIKSFKAAPQSVILGEDYLELTELSNIEKLLAEKQAAESTENAPKFDTLAADWQLEFGNLETAEEAAISPKIKGRDEEDIEMFELAFDAEIAENQLITNEDDLNFLIDNLVTEFNDPSVSTPTEAEKIAFETAENDTDNALDLPAIFNAPVVENSINLSGNPPINFFDLIGEKTNNSTNEIDENPLALTEEMDADSAVLVDKIDVDKPDITEAEMDDFLSNSFKSVEKAETDALMTNSFAVFRGAMPEALEENIAYSFIDEAELTASRIDENPLIEAEKEVEKEATVATEPTVKKVIVKDLRELELADKAAIKLEKEITRDAPSHSFRVIKKEIAREIGTNSFTIVVRDKVAEVTKIVDNQFITDENLVNKPDSAVETVPLNNLKLIEDFEFVNAPKLANEPKVIEAPPQYIMDLEDISPVFKEKTEDLSNDFEKNGLSEKTKEAPQYEDEIEEILSNFNNKTDDANAMMTAKKSDLELEILNENKVTIATKPTVQTASEDKSFTEWLRQYRMNQAEAAAQAAAYETTLKAKNTDAEVADNQLFVEKEANRKAIKHNLDALFETDSDVPENLFGFIEPTEKKVEKALDTEGASDRIRQHLNTESGDGEFAYSGEKKKKKKKKEMHELAARSIAEDNEMMSETLADLLVWQGKTTKAMEMYEKLSLAFPDKRTYFAAKIETIKSNVA